MIKVKLLVLLLIGCLAGAAQPKTGQLDALLEKTYPAGQPGAAVGVVENGKLVFEKYYGLANISTNTLIDGSTVFNIGSVSKQFTAAAILQLVSEKKISLDDKLVKFFPQLSASEINVRHLLTHSSGLLAHYSFLQFDKGTHATDDDVLKAVEKMDSLYFPPGTSYRYSNTGYDLLSLIVEKISGLTFHQYLKKNFFDKLNMTNSWVVDTLKNRSMSYEYDTTKKQFILSDADENPFFTTEGDGGVCTTLQDYVKWFNALQKNTGDEARKIQFMIDSAKKTGYGFGWRIDAAEQPALVHHTGANGAFRAYVMTIPAQNFAIIIFSNRTGIDQRKLVAEINRIFNTNDKTRQRIESLTSF